MSVWASAPGKVILFGEHAVVHGSHAVAAALTSLRVYVQVSLRSDGVVRVELEDIGESWEGSACELGIERRRGEPVQVVSGPREKQLEAAKQAVGARSTAVVAVAYLCCELCDTGGATVTAKAGGLPLGAGLGSSAALAVACSAALLASAGDFPLETVNAYAYAAEVVQHGRPSGLDNALSCFGGGCVARRDDTGLHRTSVDIPNLRLLITNTKVPRQTKDLVARVSEQLEACENPVRAMFAAIDAIALEFPRNVDRLVALNHGILRALGVSHPALERVVQEAANFDAPTKLTGAGGGGCAITLLNGLDDSKVSAPRLIPGRWSLGYVRSQQRLSRDLGASSAAPL